MKKLISLFLAALFLLSAATVGVSAAQSFTFDDSFILGDANGDGKVDAKDLFLIKSYVVGLEVEGQVLNTDAADISADGEIQSRDAFYLKASFAGVLELSSLESDYNVAAFKIGGFGIEEFCIVVPDKTEKDENIYFAATELSSYVKTATGYTLDICMGSENAVKPHAIVFNKVAYDSPLGEELGYEGYKVCFADGNLNIYGTLRGNMYCVYELLERYLKFNFYSKDTTFLKKSRCVSIPADLDETFVPALRFRIVDQSFGRESFTSRFLPMKLNGTQIYAHEEDYKYGLLTGPLFINAHSFGYYWKMATGYQNQLLNGMTPADINKDLHANAYSVGVDNESGASDWGNGTPWQPCASSQEDYNTEFEGLVQTISMIHTWGHKFLETTSIMSFSPCDNLGGLCKCRYCAAKATGKSVNISDTVRASILNNYTGQYEVSGKKVTFHKEHYAGVYCDFVNRAAYDITHTEKKYYTGEHKDVDGNTYTVDLGNIPTTYEGLELMSITYDLYVPETVKPYENIIIVFCGQGCNQHYLGTEDCGDSTTTVVNPHYTREYTNAGPNGTNYAISEWAKLCHSTGAELWFWYYPVTYAYTMAPTPCVTNVYKDIMWLVNEAHVDGIFYEGGGETYAFENLKAHIGASVLWHTDMTEAELETLIKEYMYIYYGKGYENVYTYLQMHQQCGDESGSCYINNFSTPDKMYSFDYLRLHYVEMRKLLTDAMAMTKDAEQIKHLETLIATLDTVGLQAVHDSWYTKGENTALYCEYYDEFVGYVEKYNMNFGKGAVPAAGNYETEVFKQVRYN